MTDEELLIKQAEAVLAADPGVPGGAPRWVSLKFRKFSERRLSLVPPPLLTL
jgi:hypothetical protein